MQLNKAEIELLIEALNTHKQGIEEYMDTDEPDWQKDLTETQALIDKFQQELIKGVNNERLEMERQQ